VADAGDAARRASTRVALEGLDADARGEPEAALERIETALRIDPTNPWAFLALARHRAEGIAPEAALAPLDQAETLLRLEGELDPRVEVHLLGLRGVAVAASGDAERGRALVREAARRSPATWGDGRLDAAELR
jgi:tetratricopeptide (TPR) repeat protein